MRRLDEMMLRIKLLRELTYQHLTARKTCHLGDLSDPTVPMGEGRESRSTRAGRCPAAMAFPADPPYCMPHAEVLSRQQVTNK
jgi:hypothetical protein